MSKSKPIVVIIAGPNGSGKSTLAPLLLRDNYGLLDYINADTLAAGLSAYQPEKVAFEAGRIMLMRIKELAARKTSFALESTLSSRSYAHWLRRLIEQGYEFKLLFLSLSGPSLAIERVKERIQLGGHDIPQEVVRRRFQCGVTNFFSLYQPLAESWAVWDNSSNAPTLIAKGGQTASEVIYSPNIWREFCRVGK